MAAGIRFTARSTRGGGRVFEDALINAARPAIRRASDLTGREAQDNVLSNIAGLFKSGGGKRSEPLADKKRYPYRVNTSPTGAQLVFRVDGSAKFKAKFGALNYGTGGSYEIRPKSSSQLGNKAVGFIVARGTSVTHPGFQATKFYEGGIELAVNNFRTHL